MTSGSGRTLVNYEFYAWECYDFQQLIIIFTTWNQSYYSIINFTHIFCHKNFSSNDKHCRSMFMNYNFIIHFTNEIEPLRFVLVQSETVDGRVHCTLTVLKALKLWSIWNPLYLHKVFSNAIMLECRPLKSKRGILYIVICRWLLACMRLYSLGVVCHVHVFISWLFIVV